MCLWPSQINLLEIRDITKPELNKTFYMTICICSVIGEVPMPSMSSVSLKHVWWALTFGLVSKGLNCGEASTSCNLSCSAIRIFRIVNGTFDEYLLTWSDFWVTIWLKCSSYQSPWWHLKVSSKSVGTAVDSGAHHEPTAFLECVEGRSDLDSHLTLTQEEPSCTVTPKKILVINSQQDYFTSITIGKTPWDLSTSEKTN